MATFGKNQRGVREHPDYSEGTPDRHAEGGKGDRPDGTKVHGTYRQPFSEVDPILPDPTSQVDHRSGTKDVG